MSKPISVALPPVLTLTLPCQIGPGPRVAVGQFEAVSQLGYYGFRLVEEPTSISMSDANDVGDLSICVVGPRISRDRCMAKLAQFMDEMEIPRMLIEASGHESVLLQIEEDQGTQ